MNEQNIDPDLAKRAADLEADGTRRFGKDTWGTYVGAVAKALPRSVNPADVVKAALSTDDPARAIANAGRESLLALAGSDDHQIAREAEANYQAIRQAERDAFRKARGRR